MEYLVKKVICHLFNKNKDALLVLMVWSNSKNKNQNDTTKMSNVGHIEMI